MQTKWLWGPFKEAFNVAAYSELASFAEDLAVSLASFDGYDGVCGNQIAADGTDEGAYSEFANLLADDRLLVDSTTGTCDTYLAVERRILGEDVPADCGGRSLTLDFLDTWYGLLITGGEPLSDGVDADESAHSNTAFPFLAAPAVAPEPEEETEEEAAE